MQTKHQVKCRFLLNIIISKSAPVFQLLAGKYQSLLVRRDPLFVLYLCLDIINSIRTFNFQCYSFSSQGLHKNLHSTTKTEHQMEGGLLLDVIVCKSTTIFELLARKDQPLLVWWDTLLVLDLCLDIVNGIRAFHLQCYCFTCQSLNKNLHTTMEMKHQVEGGFLLDVIVCKGTTIFKLLASKNQPLLIWWDTFFVLYFCLDIINGIRAFHLQGDGFSSQGLDKYLHPTTETKHQVKGGLFLDIVVGKSSTIFQLFTSENEPLLVWWDSFLVLNFRFHIVNSIAAFNLKGDGLSSESFHKDLHLLD